MRIAHIADVHWRALTRHDEYRKVFEDFFQKVKEQKADVIWIGGDIFHTKTSGISPEYIDLMNWWLTEMSKVCPVHLMLGNHDGNLMNLTRMDAVSPIIDALRNPRVHLYKQSGVYQFAPGWNWCVFSPFDTEKWTDVKPIEGDINIACFHGPVWGAVTEVGWELEGEVRTDFFKQFNFCMLGDIHKMQFLDYRDVELEIDETELSKFPDAEIIWRE